MKSIIILIGIILILLFGCDQREASPYIKVQSDASQAYVADSTNIPIKVRYENRDVYNQRIYIETNNGVLDKEYINTDLYGNGSFGYNKPDSVGFAVITIWSFVQGNKLTDTLTLNILQEKNFYEK